MKQQKHTPLLTMCKSVLHYFIDGLYMKKISPKLGHKMQIVSLSLHRTAVLYMWLVTPLGFT